MAAVSFGAEGAWIRKADMPTKRFGVSSAEVDGKIFVIGGSQSGKRLATVEVYDPATDTWEAGVDMPTARSGHASTTVKGKIYAIGGQTGITWEENAGTIYATVEAFALPAAAAPQLTIQKSVLLSWKQSGKNHVAESASSPEGPWTKVVDFESRMFGDEVHMTVIQTGASQFFRLSVTP